MKKLFYNDKGKKYIKRGVDKTANLIKLTLGVGGRTVIIKNNEGISATKDGATVAKEIELSNPYENVGARMIIEVAEKSANISGDGTTTTAVLAQAIINECYKRLKKDTFSFSSLYAKRYTANQITNQLKKELEKVLIELKDLSKPINNDITKLKQVIGIASNGDSEIIKVIGEIIDRIGKDSVINFEESLNNETYSKILEGMSFEKGWVHPKFVTNKINNSCELDKPFVLVVDKINSIVEIKDILDFVVQSGRSLLIVCNEISDGTIAQLLANKESGLLKIGVVYSPHFGVRRNETIEDICCYTNTELIGKEGKLTLEEIEDYIQDLGELEKCIIHKEYTIMQKTSTSDERIKNRIKEIEEHIKDTKYDFDIERLKDRLSRLIGGIATIYVGGITEIEMREKKDRVEDAIKALKSAIEEGICAGGGITFISAGSELEKNAILYNCLWEPFKQILKNVDLNWKIIRNQIETYKIDGLYYGYGYNVKTEEFGYLIDMGVLDSHKVLKVALINAVSIAITFINSKGLIVEVKKEEINNVLNIPIANNLYDNLMNR